MKREQKGQRGRREVRKEAGPPVKRERAGRDVLTESKKGNRQILFLTYLVVAVFLGLSIYLVLFIVMDSEKVINNPYNKRQEVMAKRIQRGKILSSDGKVLAKTKTNKKGEDTRIYPYGEVFCHAVGRTTNSMTGVEKTQCYTLLASHANPVEQLINTFRGDKNPGDNVVTTLHADLQQIAYNALGNQRGAVVAMEPSTGKVLAMVSKPAYDPNTVSLQWKSLVDDSTEESKLINRASQGLYPPGSTFKILTEMEYMIENPETYQDFRYQCKGSDSFSGNVINCYGKERHGMLTLKSAFAKSCNGAFAELGTKLDISSYCKLIEKFRFNTKMDVDFEMNKSTFSLTKESDMGELTQTVIGQGKTLITPMENALIAATIANKGKMMKRYIVDHVESVS